MVFIQCRIKRTNEAVASKVAVVGAEDEVAARGVVEEVAEAEAEIGLQGAVRPTTLPRTCHLD